MTAPGLAGPAAGGAIKPHAASGAWIPQNRLIRQEVALGVVREIVPPTEHIGLSLCPWMNVATDDVIFDYVNGSSDGLAPARAEDAESELSQKDDLFSGQGRASVLDWALKDSYTASDVNRYRELLTVVEAIRDTKSVPLTVSSGVEGFTARMARDTALRRRKLDNRLEWMIMNQALSTGSIAYNDGKIKFAVDYGRPTTQQAAHADNDITSFVTNGVYTMNSTTHDPIGWILAVQELMYGLYGVKMNRAICSRKILNNFMNSDRFIARSGMLVGGTPSSPIDLNYVVDGWGPAAAIAVIEKQTGVTFMEYDSVYRTRAVGGTTFTNNRFFPENRILFLPDESEIAEFDNTEIGFAKTLTSPHPAGNWQPGFYEWEYEHGVDPWKYDVGTGVKAFPVFTHMELTYAVDVTLP